MTRRAVALGLALGMIVSVATYFNDWIIGQTLFIGNYLPISVFGTMVVLALGINPVLHRLSQRLPFSGGEIAVATALALTACGWPSSTLYRYLTTATALPAHWLKTTASWQSAQVMSYVPGASAELGEGHLQDLEAIVRRLHSAATLTPPSVARVHAAELSDSVSPARALWLGLSAEGRRNVAKAAAEKRIDFNLRSALTRNLNEALAKPDLFGSPLAAGAAPPPHQIVLENRLRLVQAFPGAVLPPPRGDGALVDGGRADPFVVDTLMRGRGSANQLSLGQLPWQVWWPTLRLWGGAAFLLGLCGLCLALVVHPQWSKRELLPYPIVRFLREASERAPGKSWPVVASSKVFWVAFVGIAFWHTVNGLHAWFPEVPEIPRRFDLGSLGPLFPNASRVNGTYGWLGPTLYPSVIAFSFFMGTSVAFSLGAAQLLFFAFGSALIVKGIPLNVTTSGASPASLLRFGGYVAATLIIGYTGRHYYRQVLLGAVGRARGAELPASAVWALRVLFVCGFGAMICLRSAGADWLFAALFVALALMIALVITRIAAETGNFFVAMEWSAAAVVTALFGFEAVGPTAFIVMAMATQVLIPDMREAVMPYLTHGLKLTEGEASGSPARITAWMMVMLVSGFLAAGAVTFYLQYNNSVIQVGNEWATHGLPKLAFDALARLISDARVQGTLALATAGDASLKWSLVMPAQGALLWTGLGLLLVLGASLARLRLPWWPLHPVAFLVWDTYAIIMFGPSFLLGWMVKAAVVSAGGARAHHLVRPLMIGVIAAELASGLFWIGVGIAYYVATGQRPASYAIFPL